MLSNHILCYDFSLLLVNNKSSIVNVSIIQKDISDHKNSLQRFNSTIRESVFPSMTNHHSQWPIYIRLYGLSKSDVNAANVLTESKRYSQAIHFYTQAFEKAPMVKIIGENL